MNNDTELIFEAYLINEWLNAVVAALPFVGDAAQWYSDLYVDLERDLEVSIKEFEALEQQYNGIDNIPEQVVSDFIIRKDDEAIAKYVDSGRLPQMLKDVVKSDWYQNRRETDPNKFKAAMQRGDKLTTLAGFIPFIWLVKYIAKNKTGEQAGQLKGTDIHNKAIKAAGNDVYKQAGKVGLTQNIAKKL